MLRFSPLHLSVIGVVCLAAAGLAAQVPPTYCDIHGRLDASLLKAAGFPEILPTETWSFFAEESEPPRDVPDDCWTGSFPSPDVDGWISSIASYGGDIVVAGSFWQAGGQWAANIARFDGVTWQPLGGGFNGSVYCLQTTLDGRLVAGGAFNIAGGVPANRIAVWDGQNWSPLGQGMNETVDTLTEYGGMLIAGGGFTVAGATYANHIAAWSGSAWQPLAAGFNDDVEDLTVFGTQLVATGYFTSAGTSIVNGIAAWNGNAWTPLGAGLAGDGDSLCSHDGRLYVAGSFDFAGTIAADGMAAWDGAQWHSVPSAPDDYGDRIIYSFEGTLLFGRSSSALDDPFDNIYALVDDVWQPYGWALAEPESQVYVAGFGVHDGELHAVGQNFVRCRHDGQWSARRGAGFDAQINDLVEYAGSAVAVGNFTHAGTVDASGVAVLAAGEWTALGAAGELSGGIQTATVYGGDLVIGGWFELAGHGVVNLARWDGAAWQPLGGGVDGIVYALSVHDGELWVGGSFEHAGETYAVGLATWTGSAWIAHDANGAVMAMLSRPDGLVVAGNFTYLDGYAVHARGIAAWDGIEFVPLNDGSLDCDGVTAITWHDGFLHAAVQGNDVESLVYRLDAGVWEALGETDPYVYPNIVKVLLSYDGALFAGGSAMLLDGNLIENLAWWSGDTWVNLADFSATGYYYGSDVSALLPWGGDLLVGGTFTEVNNRQFQHMVIYECGAPVGVADGDTSTPSAVRLLCNAPNPFNPRTVIAFELPTAVAATLAVYDVTGRRMRTLIDGTVVSAGRHEIAWDGRDSAGRAAPSGVYLYRLEASGETRSQRMTLLR